MFADNTFSIYWSVPIDPNCRSYSSFLQPSAIGCRIIENESDWPTGNWIMVCGKVTGMSQAYLMGFRIHSTKIFLGGMLVKLLIAAAISSHNNIILSESHWPITILWEEMCQKSSCHPITSRLLPHSPRHIAHSPNSVEEHCLRLCSICGSKMAGIVSPREMHA